MYFNLGIQRSSETWQYNAESRVDDQLIFLVSQHIQEDRMAELALGFLDMPNHQLEAIQYQNKLPIQKHKVTIPIAFYIFLWMNFSY